MHLLAELDDKVFLLSNFHCKREVSDFQQNAVGELILSALWELTFMNVGAVSACLV